MSSPPICCVITYDDTATGDAKSAITDASSTFLNPNATAIDINITGLKVATGTPQQISENTASYTGHFLKKYFEWGGRF